MILHYFMFILVLIVPCALTNICVYNYNINMKINLNTIIVIQLKDSGRNDFLFVNIVEVHHAEMEGK